MSSLAYDVCDGDGCGVRSNQFPFPHAPGCKYEAEAEDWEEIPVCRATFREEPMTDTVYCNEPGYHTRHTAWQGQDYYAWLDGDDGAGHEEP